MPMLPPLGAQDGGVDADYVALGIEQGAAAIAFVDGGVGLDQSFEGAVLIANFAAQRAHDAGGERAGKAERIADGEDLLPDLQGIGIAQFQERQFFLGIDLDHGQIVGAIGHQDFGGVAAAIGKAHFDFGAAADDVIVGENAAVGADQEARSQRARGHHFEEKGLLINRAGDVGDAVFGGLVNLDIVDFVAAQSGGVRDGGAAPQRAVDSAAEGNWERW